jgi:hypothetical protein
MNEALSQPAFEFLPMADQKFRWGYVPEKEYDGKRYVVCEMSDTAWIVATFAEGDEKVLAKKNAKTIPDATEVDTDTKLTQESRSTKEVIKLQSLVESMFSDTNVKNHGDYRMSLTEGVPTLSKIEGPGVGAMQNWYFVSGAKYDFENCLKRCVGIVTGKEVEGGVQTMGEYVM